MPESLEKSARKGASLGEHGGADRTKIKRDAEIAKIYIQSYELAPSLHLTVLLVQYV